jgi:hypothetical protein
VPRLCELYPGICLVTEEIAQKNLIQGSRRVADGTMKRGAVPPFCLLYSDICHTPDEKAQNNLSQGGDSVKGVNTGSTKIFF